MDGFAASVERMAEAVAHETGTRIAAPRRISDNMPTPGDALLLDVLDAACETAGASHRRMASGAGHDTAFMAKVTRAAMIFVPCLGGRSHAPEEFAETDDIAGHQRFQCAVCVGAAQLRLAHMRNIEQRRARAALFVLLQYAGRILHRHVVAGERHHARAQRDVKRVQRRLTQWFGWVALAQD